MNPPKDVTIYESELATMWLDEEGILYIIAKKAERTPEKQKAQFDFVSKLTKGQKVCAMADISLSASMDKKTREQSAELVPKTFKAMAVLSNSTFARFFANLYMGLIKQSVPVRLFEKEEEALNWLRLFLDK